MKPSRACELIIQIWFWYALALTVVSTRAERCELPKYILLCLIPGILAVLFVEFIIPMWLSDTEKDKWKWKKNEKKD